MHFPDESYVRKYTRKTLTSRLLKWQGRAVLDAMLGEFDRAGVFDLIGDPVECISTVTELPEEIVRVGLERLLATKTWTVTGTAIVWPTYVDAQACARSDKARQGESRKRRAANAVTRGTEPVTPAAPREEPVTPTAEVVTASTDAVTPCHEPSHRVTPILADPNLTKPSLSDPDPERARTDGSGVRGPSWWSFPKGWRWSDETEQEAKIQGIRVEQLREHVEYWTIHEWSVAVKDLDGELVRSLPNIRLRSETTHARPKPGLAKALPPGDEPEPWGPDVRHRELAEKLELGDFDLLVNAYNRSARPRDRPGPEVDNHFANWLRRRGKKPGLTAIAEVA